MSAMKHILRKELRSYFVSPIAYIVATLFLAVTGWLFFSTFFLNGQASMGRFFTLLPITFAFIIPAITMRLFSEEINVGSYELLITLPVTHRDVILGKFFSALAFVAFMLAPTLLYAISVDLVGELDWGPVLGGYMGALLLAGAFAAIGLLASSLTRNQVVAFMVGVSICFSLAMMLDFVVYFLPEFMVDAVQYLSADLHFRSISRGVLDSRDLVYFLSVTVMALLATDGVMKETK